MSEDYKFGDRAIADACEKIAETERKLAAAPAGRNPRRWTKYYRDELKKAHERLSSVFNLIDQHNRGYKFSEEESQHIGGLAQAIAEDQIIYKDGICEDETACESNLRRIEENSGCIKQLQSGNPDNFVSGLVEEAIARLTRENAVRREAARCAMLIRRAA